MRNNKSLRLLEEEDDIATSLQGGRGMYYPPSLFNPSSVMIPASNPLNTLAKSSPGDFTEVAMVILNNDVVSERNETIHALSSDHKDMVCTFLTNRQPDENEIELVSGGGGRSRGWFGSGEETAFKTSVRIGKRR